MAYLQFLSGGRDQEIQVLDDGASLTVGSGEGAHVKVDDPGVEGEHCKVYPAEGSFWLQDLCGQTVLRMRRMQPQSTEGLQDKDVFILGRTFVKFWVEEPASGGGGGGGADPAELEAAKEAEASAKAELESAKAELESAKAELESAKAELGSAQEALEGAKGEAESLKEQVESLEGAKGEAEQRAQAAEGERDEKVRELEQALEQAKLDAEVEVEAAQTRAAQELEQAKEAVAAETESMREALTASRAALEVLKQREELLRSAAQGEAPTIARAMEALGLPDAAVGSVEAAIEAEAERRALARMGGPVVPLRGLRAPGSGEELEASFRAAQERARQVEVARTLGLHELSEDELEALRAEARS